MGWRKSSRSLSEKTRSDAREKFFNTPPCNLRDEDAKKLQKMLHRASDLDKRPYCDLLDAMVKDLEVHIGDVERMHGENKDIARHAYPSAMGVERLALEAYLKQSKKKYLQCGSNLDFSKLTSKVLARSGFVTVRAARLAKQSHRSSAQKRKGGVALQFRNKNQGRGPGRRQQIELAGMWRNLKRDDVDDFKCIMQNAQRSQHELDDNKRRAQEEAALAAEVTEASAESSPMFMPSDKHWACSESKMDFELQTETHRCGIKKLGAKRRKTFVGQLLVPDPEGWAPTEKSKPLKQCQAQHPGLCRDTHKPVYDMASSRECFVVGPFEQLGPPNLFKTSIRFKWGHIQQGLCSTGPCTYGLAGAEACGSPWEGRRRGSALTVQAIGSQGSWPYWACSL